MIPRKSTKELVALSERFKSVAVIGPRQSGKTTLVRNVFPNKAYVSLENPDTRNFALEDPRGFLAMYPQGAILDEVQRAPQIFSYLQQILDESDTKGLFILTGSNNFLLQENISQSLSGRIAYLFLLPLSFDEPESTDVNQFLFRGGYPGIYNDNIEPFRFFPNYIRTYIERDVRLLKNIIDLTAFERFLRLCAGRIGQLLNMSSLAVEAGVDVKTISSWIGVLEASFILFRLLPHHKNFNKRLVKMPKIYFYDTGLACSLLGISSIKILDTHPLRGSLFENMVITEFLKENFSRGTSGNLFFWRDNTGNEIDLILDQDNKLIPVEIKSGQTITDEYFKNLRFWAKISGSESGYVVYGGQDLQKRSNGISVVPFTRVSIIYREM
jgi:predicted AAA+ superfamily ATPase